ncbi:Stk1 family PASTA domain-containing Ser/Thr kinase [Terrimesophilobacter mesophilus]|uniref:non-specific serine/threonine protein kinase n=2 Tax=Terrimesophilobacter mesophilus TaxID=433647 RepID=A0A4R8VET8_9MICO|nr:Stk1 family PASTA domain-containing Ser/Thr kinase [Terrimesophilobacter mesophilus]TFB80702.1 Stk1 family PASTA domain-containing Ser/Thr kinase [Terrimesophilobacter mesophilus]
MVGRLIDGRYQVRSRIARGGMATVYLATDLRLERRVAIKVMHGHLADDTQYKARFIQEARSAARLAHPNVVNVYDQGQDADTAYLVMEYLPGITLRELLHEHPVLTTDQAMDIMDAILSGLAAAHRNGIVHRDLKPENVLLADDGRIKISDFGLARAATAQTATGNALLGTIAYLSPELVTRGVADARSDIYAVGIMLYEMLAGEQPYKGEQPFQIAQQHANDTVPTPSSKNPRVPAELDELVLWATARDPEQRPRDARAMLEQLHETRHILEGGQKPAPTPATMQTMVMPSAAPRAAETETQVLGTRVRQRTGPIASDSAATLSTLADRRHSRSRWLFALILILVALAGATGWYFGTGPGSKVSIPDVAGKDVAAATAILLKSDLTVSKETKGEFTTTVPEGKVVGTDPKIGSSVAHGGTVTIIVSKGPEPLAMPPVVGGTEDAARAALEPHFDLQETQYQFDSGQAAGIVLAVYGVDRTGKELDLSTVTEYWDGQPITLTVSLGPIPDVRGMSVAEAQKALSDKDLVGSRSDKLHDWSDDVPEGDVIGYKPLPEGTVVTKGTELQLIVSDGVEQVPVPDVVGLSWYEAKKTLLDAGFKLDYDARADLLPSAVEVRKTDPRAGATVDKGSTIHVEFKGF